MKAKIRANYHWVIALVVLVEMAVYGGVINNVTGLYIIPVTQSMEVSRSSFSLVMSIRSLTAFGFGMVSSVLFLHFGYRKLVTIGLVGGALALVLMSFSKSLIGIGFGAAVLGICEGLYSTVGATRIIGDWFHRHRGMVLGVVTAATGIGGSIFCTIQSEMIETAGWPASYRFSALMMALTAVLIVLAARNRPEQMGLQPHGEGQLPTRHRHRAGVSQDNWPGYSLAQLVRKPTFYLMMSAIFLGCLSLYLAFYVVVPHLQDCGLSVSQAASIQSAMLLLLAVAKLAIGSLSDVLGGKHVTTLCMVCTALGLWLLAGVQDMTSGLVAVVVYSVGLPLTTITVPLLTTGLFGYRAHDTAVGVFLSMVSVGSLVASPICNLAYDLLGSYRPVFRAAAVLALATLGLFFLLYRLADRDRKQWQETNPAASSVSP